MLCFVLKDKRQMHLQSPPRRSPNADHLVAENLFCRFVFGVNRSNEKNDPKVGKRAESGVGRRDLSGEVG